MFETDITEYFNTLGDNGTDYMTVEELILQNFREAEQRRKTNTQGDISSTIPEAPIQRPSMEIPEPGEEVYYSSSETESSSTMSEAEDQEREFTIDEIWNQTPENTYAPQHEFQRIPVPRGTSAVTKKKLIDQQEEIMKLRKELQNMQDDLESLWDKQITTQQELDMAQSEKEGMRDEWKEQQQNLMVLMSKYEEELQKTSDRAIYYENELHRRESDFQENKKFWEETKQKQTQHIRQLQNEIESMNRDFYTTLQTADHRLKNMELTLRDKEQLMREREERHQRQMNEIYTSFSVALDQQRQNAERRLLTERSQAEAHILSQEERLQNQEQLINQQVNELNRQDTIIQEQQAEILHNENTIADMHEQMYQMNERQNEIITTAYAEPGSSLMTANHLAIAGYRKAIGDGKEIIWDTATLTNGGNHYVHPNLEKSYFVNWVKSNTLDKLALKHGLLRKRGTGYINYHLWGDNYISGRTAYNTILQFTDATNKVLNAAEKAKQGLQINTDEQLAIGVASRIYQDPEATGMQDQPKLLRNLLLAYESWLGNRRQVLM